MRQPLRSTLFPYTTLFRSYGSNGLRPFFRAVQKTADGGFIVAGNVDLAATADDFIVLKFGPSGSLDWQRTYGAPNTDLAFSITQTADGGFVVAGGSDSFGDTRNAAWVLRLTSLGAIVWQRSYRAGDFDFASSIRETADGGLLISGMTTGPTGNDGWVLRLDANGSIKDTGGGACSLGEDT